MLKFDLVMIGEKGKMFFKRSSTDWVITPEALGAEFKAPDRTIPRVESEDAEWLAACKGGPAALSDFANSGPFTEVVLLGNLAIRTGKKLTWDGPAMKAGLKKGEIIVSAGDQKLRYRDQLMRLVRKKKPGQAMELTGGGPQGTGQRKLKVTVGRLEVQWTRVGTP